MTGRWLWRAGTVLVAAATLAVMLIGQFPLLAGSVLGSAPGPDADPRDGPCLPGRAVPVVASPHVGQADLAGVAYNSRPPTSGPHFAFTVAPGIYDGPVSDGLLVHALEHGHVAILYAPGTPQATVARLADVARRHSRDVVLAPYPELPSGIALTAWGRIDVLATYDGQRVETFVQRLRNRYAHGWRHAADC